jgi:hypothetical protein
MHWLGSLFSYQPGFQITGHPWNPWDLQVVCLGDETLQSSALAFWSVTNDAGKIQMP